MNVKNKFDINCVCQREWYKMNKGCIFVAVAMEVEIKVLLDKLDNLTMVEKYGFTLYEGKINDRDIVVMLTGVGVINASSGVMMGIMEYSPSVVINYGIAGAISKDIHTKDIMVGSIVVNINSYRTAELREGEGSNPDDWELLTFLSGQPDRYIEYSADDWLLGLSKEVKYDNGSVIYAKIGSGDVWNREVDRMLFLNREYGVLAEDMESVSIYQLCNRLNIPVISIKIISDNGLIGEDYDRNVGVYLQDYIYSYLRLVSEKKIS